VLENTVTLSASYRNSPPVQNMTVNVQQGINKQLTLIMDFARFSESFLFVLDFDSTSLNQQQLPLT
jgi:hypothetical protein